MSKPIIIIDYDPNWPVVFSELRDRIARALDALVVTIEHVGSTSVPGLAAKPIIDMDVVVASAAEIPAAVQRLAPLGYVHQGDLGIPGREAFVSPPDWPDHHLYLCPLESEELRRHILFRDYLRAHPEEARAYGALKRALADRFRDDRDAYAQAKTVFVGNCLRGAEERGVQ
jgi:GrpB-like predicted nucleotidyltransferase (UPF0157 family)